MLFSVDVEFIRSLVWITAIALASIAAALSGALVVGRQARLRFVKSGTGRGLAPRRQCRICARLEHVFHH